MRARTDRRPQVWTAPQLLVGALAVALAASACGGSDAASPGAVAPSLAPSASAPDGTPAGTSDDLPFPRTTRIAFMTADRDCGKEWCVGLANADGSNRRLVFVDEEAVVGFPEWSPDGTRMLLNWRFDAEPSPLRIWDLETDEVSIPFPCEDDCFGDDEATWSADGERVAFVRYEAPFLEDRYPADCGLWVGEVATGTFEQILSTEGTACDRPVLPRFSPDGTQIVYFRERFEDARARGDSAVFLLDVASRAETRLTEWDDQAGYPEFSPDGEWILFVSYPRWLHEPGSADNELYRMRPDGSGVEQLTDFAGSGVYPNQPRYSPDGTWIVFVADLSDGSAEIWAIPAAGGDAVKLLHGGNHTHPAVEP